LARSVTAGRSSFRADRRHAHRQAFVRVALIDASDAGEFFNALGRTLASAPAIWGCTHFISSSRRRSRNRSPSGVG
jgi:hypothetical protein